MLQWLVYDGVLKGFWFLQRKTWRQEVHDLHHKKMLLFCCCTYKMDNEQRVMWSRCSLHEVCSHRNCYILFKRHTSSFLDVLSLCTNTTATNVTSFAVSIAVIAAGCVDCNLASCSSNRHKQVMVRLKFKRGTVEWDWYKNITSDLTQLAPKAKKRQSHNLYHSWYHHCFSLLK